MNIYKIKNNINGKIYIGKDTGDNAKYMGSGTLIKRAIEKYGIENFSKEILEYCNDNKTLCNRERYWISKLDSRNLKKGYNITEGGEGGDTYTNNPNLPQIKEKLSISMKDRVFSDEHRKKLRKAGSNRKHSEETKQKMKKPKSEEHKRKLSEAAKSQWKKQKETGFEISDETRKKLSEKRKEYWQRKKAEGLTETDREKFRKAQAASVKAKLEKRDKL